jgi:hypothetical protein
MRWFMTVPVGGRVELAVMVGMSSCGLRMKAAGVAAGFYVAPYGSDNARGISLANKNPLGFRAAL